MNRFVTWITLAFALCFAPAAFATPPPAAAMPPQHAPTHVPSLATGHRVTSTTTARPATPAPERLTPPKPAAPSGYAQTTGIARTVPSSVSGKGTGVGNRFSVATDVGDAFAAPGTDKTVRPIVTAVRYTDSANYFGGAEKATAHIRVQIREARPGDEETPVLGPMTERVVDVELVRGADGTYSGATQFFADGVNGKFEQQIEGMKVSFTGKGRWDSDYGRDYDAYAPAPAATASTSTSTSTVPAVVVRQVPTTALRIAGGARADAEDKPAESDAATTKKDAAATKPASSAPSGPMTARAAASIAAKLVDKQMAEDPLPKGVVRSRATPVDVQFVPDPDLPVTGKGRIVSLVVKQSPGPNATKGQRFLYAFPLKLTNKYKSRQIDVYVDEDGNAFQLGATQSLDAFTKLRNWIKPASLMQEEDLTKNLATVGTHVAAITAATMVPALIPVEIGAGLIHIAYVHKSAVALAHSANETAIGATTEWASKLVDAGHAPNLAEAYSFYLGKLDEGGTGAQPLNAVEFARLFAAQGM